MAYNFLRAVNGSQAVFRGAEPALGYDTVVEPFARIVALFVLNGNRKLGLVAVQNLGYVLVEFIIFYGILVPFAVRGVKLGYVLAVLIVNGIRAVCRVVLVEGYVVSKFFRSVL